MPASERTPQPASSRPVESGANPERSQRSSAQKSLVALWNGGISASSAAHVLDLDAAACADNAHDILDTIAALKEADTDGRSTNWSTPCSAFSTPRSNSSQGPLNHFRGGRPYSETDEGTLVLTVSAVSPVVADFTGYISTKKT